MGKSEKLKKHWEKINESKMTWTKLCKIGIREHDVLFLGTGWQFITCSDGSKWWMFVDLIIPSAGNF